jgi:hypothetical protein
MIALDEAACWTWSPAAIPSPSFSLSGHYRVQGQLCGRLVRLHTAVGYQKGRLTAGRAHAANPGLAAVSTGRRTPQVGGHAGLRQASEQGWEGIERVCLHHN